MYFFFEILFNNSIGTVGCYFLRFRGISLLTRPVRPATVVWPRLNGVKVILLATPYSSATTRVQHIWFVFFGGLWRARHIGNISWLTLG